MWPSPMVISNRRIEGHATLAKKFFFLKCNILIRYCTVQLMPFLEAPCRHFQMSTATFNNVYRDINCTVSKCYGGTFDQRRTRPQRCVRRRVRYNPYSRVKITIFFACVVHFPLNQQRNRHVHSTVRSSFSFCTSASVQIVPIPPHVRTFL